jgi:hypothetical protein
MIVVRLIFKKKILIPKSNNMLRTIIRRSHFDPTTVDRRPWTVDFPSFRRVINARNNRQH